MDTQDVKPTQRTGKVTFKTYSRAKNENHPAASVYRLDGSPVFRLPKTKVIFPPARSRYGPVSAPLNLPLLATPEVAVWIEGLGIRLQIYLEKYNGYFSPLRPSRQNKPQLLNVKVQEVGTKIMVVQPDDSVKNGQVDDIRRGCSIIPLVSFKGWSTKERFGGTLRLRAVIVFPKEKEFEFVDFEADLDEVTISPQQLAEEEKTTFPSKIYVVAQECVACRDAKVASLLSPCWHVCMCLGCSRKLKTCPMCRATITSVTKFDLSE